MAKNGNKRQCSKSSSVEPSKRKILRVESPSFEEEINSLLLASDQSDSEGDFEDCIISESNHSHHQENDRVEDSEESGKSRRWPMVVFYRILDLNSMKAHILHNMHQPKIIERGDFLKTSSFVSSPMGDQTTRFWIWIQRRVVCSQLPRELRFVIKRILDDDMVEEDVQSHETSQGKRKACRICPPKLHRMTVYTCVGCCDPVCLQCSRPLCKNCQ